MRKCVKCGSEKSISTIEIDKKKPARKWRVFRCGHCDHAYDLEPYIDALIKRPKGYEDRDDTDES